MARKPDQSPARDPGDVPPGLVLFRPDDGGNVLRVRIEGETVWLTQAQMAELFQTTKQNVSLHLRNILSDRELDEASVVKEYLTTAADGKEYRTLHYSLAAILAVGYRVRSPRGTQFRQWATATLSEFLVKGFVLDDERLKEGRSLGSGARDYFDELLERIRDIRASERRCRLDPQARRLPPVQRAEHPHPRRQGLRGARPPARGERVRQV